MKDGKAQVFSKIIRSSNRKDRRQVALDVSGTIPEEKDFRFCVFDLLSRVSAEISEHPVDGDTVVSVGLSKKGKVISKE